MTADLLELPTPCLSRENMLETIDRMLEGNYVAIIEGPEGHGKTVIAKLFARRHKPNTITLFIRTGSRWAYEPAAICMELSQQIAEFLGRSLTVEEPVTTQVYSALLLKLRRHLATKHQSVVFIIDGLSEIPELDSQYAKQIWDLLPFDVPGCKFVITTDDNTPHGFITSKIKRTIFLPTLGPEESSQYLDGLGLDETVMKQLQQTCRGHPSILATVRRLVQAGMSPDSLYEHITSELSDLFHFEWNHACADPLTKEIIAITVFDSRQNTAVDIARLLNTDAEAILRQLGSVPFIAASSPPHVIQFISEPYRRFAATRLAANKQEVEDIIIRDPLDRQSELDVAAILPDYLHNAGRLTELLAALTPENFERALHHSQSLTPLKQHVDYGVKASLALSKDSDLVRFSIQKSALLQLESTDVLKSEVEARIALDQFEAAYALANSAGLKEDRLHLFAVIAKEQLKRSRPVEAELSALIESLYSQVDCRHLGKRALEIASDLIYTAPTLAIEMVEQSNAEGSETESDIAIATLALTAPKSIKLENGDNYAKELQSKIRSPELKAFIDETAIKTSNTSAKDIEAQIRPIPSAERKLFLLRRWAVQNAERADAHEVVELSISLAIRATEYTPNARDMRELATPLPHIKNSERLQHLVSLFAANAELIKRYGPTVDYIRFLLLLGRGEYLHDKSKGRKWLEEAYLQTSTIKELEVRAEAYSWLLVDLATADPGKELESTDQMHTLAHTGLTETVDELRVTSALQEFVFASVLKPLCAVRTDLALSIAKSLNTESRRDEALAQIVESQFDGPLQIEDISSIPSILAEIVDPEVRDKSLWKGLNKLSRKKSLQRELQTGLLQLIETTRSVGDPVRRSQSLTRLYYCFTLLDAPPDSPHMISIYNGLETGLSEIDVTWEKIRVAFEAVAILAASAPAASLKLLAIAEEAKEHAYLQTGKAAAAYISTILLSIFSFAGLLARKLTDDNDISRLAQLIDRIPSDGERSQMWAEIALRFHTHKQTDQCQRIVKERVRPLIEGLLRQSTRYGSEVISRVAPALYVAHPTSAQQDIKSLTPQLREHAYGNIAVYLLEGRTSFEPFETLSNQAYDIDYEKSLDLLGVIEQFDRDDSIYHFLTDLTNSLVADKHVRITGDQLNATIARIETLASSKFPNPKYITHEGYAICVQALVLKLKRAKASDFSEVSDRARALPNLSDKVFVLSMIAAAYTKRDRSHAKVLLQEAFDLANTLLCTYDRVARIRTVAIQALEVDRELAKRILESGMQIAVESGDQELWQLQRAMLDFAYRIEPEYAATLASLADNDPARRQMRHSLQQRLDVLNTTRALAERPKARQKFKEEEDDYPQAAWRLLGQLNAGRIASKTQDEMREFVRIAAQLPVSEAYPILAWVIGNAVARYARTDQASLYLRPIFESTLTASRIAGRMADHNLRVVKAAFVGDQPSQFNDPSDLIRAGERELAMSRIRVWIEQKVGDDLTICDPFFGPDDMDVLKLVLAIKPDVQVRVLSSINFTCRFKHRTMRHILRTGIRSCLTRPHQTPR